VKCGGVVEDPDETCCDEIVYILWFSDVYRMSLSRLESLWLEVEEQDGAFENCLVIPSIALQGVVERSPREKPLNDHDNGSEDAL
jgi:hypothetical protein